MQDSTQLPPHDEPAGGPLSNLLASLRQTGATLVGMAQTRIELLTTELQEEIQRAARVLLWAFVGLLAAGIGLFMAALLVIFVFWDTHRVLAAVVVTSMFFAIAIGAALHARNMLRDKPRLLDATLEELARDRERLEARVRRQS